MRIMLSLILSAAIFLSALTACDSAPVPPLTPVPTPTPAVASPLTPSPTPKIQDIDGMTNISITIGNTVFSAKLYDNDAANALTELFPLTVDMTELNGNEKYYYLSNSFPADSQQLGSVNAGDLMLYDSDCLVLFYESFNTSYSYTKLGYIEDASGLTAALGKGNVQVAFGVSD